MPNTPLASRIRKELNTPLARKVAKVQQLAELAKEVAKDMANEGPLNLTDRQRKALYNVLRTLDLRNDYEEGDELRLAFGIELDGLRSR